MARDIARWESVMEASHALLAEQFGIIMPLAAGANSPHYSLA